MPNADDLLTGLDPEQREVALALRGPVSVVAGAGTGKTRAITHRMAYGVATGVYKPTEVLAQNLARHRLVVGDQDSHRAISAFVTSKDGVAKTGIRIDTVVPG